FVSVKKLYSSHRLVISSKCEFKPDDHLDIHLSFFVYAENHSLHFNPSSSDLLPKQHAFLQHVFPDMLPLSWKLQSSSPLFSAHEFFEELRPPHVFPEVETPNGLNVHLLPFQRRTLYWMLNREGVLVD